MPCFLRMQQQQQHSLPGVPSWIEQVKLLLSWKYIKSIPPNDGWHSNLSAITEMSSRVEKCGQFVTVSLSFFFSDLFESGKGRLKRQVMREQPRGICFAKLCACGWLLSFHSKRKRDASKSRAQWPERRVNTTYAVLSKTHKRDSTSV